MFIGHGRQAGSGPNPARQVGRRAGLPDSVPAQTINQACASGLQAIALGAQAIQLGQSSVVLSGGIESMSRMPYLIDSEDAPLGPQDGQLHARGRDVPRRVLLPAVAAHHGPDRRGARAPVRHHARGVRRLRAREPADAPRRRSRPAGSRTRSRRRRARTRKAQPVELDRDEHPRAGATIEGLRKLPLVFEPVDGAPGIITAGIVVGHHRRRRRGRAGERRRGDDSAASRRWRASSAGRRPASIRGSWASARCRRCGSCSTARA